MLPKPKRLLNILLVEDSEIDILILKRVFERIKIQDRLYVSHTGEDALDFVNGIGNYACAKQPLPDLMLLDILLPGIDGFEVLEKLRSNPRHRRIPVIMLTTSSAQEDIAKSYDSGASSFITKPVDVNKFVEIMEHFYEYWSVVSRIPSTEGDK